MVAITVTGAPPLSMLRPELGKRLSDVVARAMSPVPEKRFADARELRKALLEILPELPVNVNCVVQNALDTHPGNHPHLGNGKSGRTEELGPRVSSVPAALTVARAPSIVPSPPLEAWADPRVRGSIAIAAAGGVALMAWFALSLPTSGTARAGLDPAVRSQLSAGRLSLSHLGPTEPHTPAPLALDVDRGTREPEEPRSALVPLALRDEDSEALTPLQPAAAEADLEKSQARKPDRAVAPKRPRARDLKVRTPSSDRPPRLYKKLDF
jgi:hypothetical protein